MFTHAGFDASIIGEALEVALRTRGVGEVGEGEDAVEGVGCFLLSFAPVSMAGGGCGFNG